MRIPSSLHFLIAAAVFLVVALPLCPDLWGVDHLPQLINYQGRLTDAQGNPLNGAYNLKFTLWDAETGGNQLWSEDHPAVAVTDGLFQIALGNTNHITSDVLTPPLSPTESFFDVYLEITVDGQEIVPRVALTSAPYAMLTHRVDGDITTDEGKIIVHSSSDSPPSSSINISADDTCSFLQMEAEDNLSITKQLDKASPKLFLTTRTIHDKGMPGDSITMSAMVDDTCALSLMSAAEGMSLTKAYDKASPQLYECGVETGNGTAVTKIIDKASPLLYESTVESSEGTFSLTKVYDKASPQLYECGVETGNGAAVMKRIDKSSPLLYESTVESSDGTFSLTKVYDKSSPQLHECGVETGNGTAVMKRIDKSSPLLYESTVESSEGTFSLTKVYDKASPQLYEYGVETGDGTFLTKAYDKASPQLYECGIETGNGAVVTKRMDKSSPLLYESMVESSDGVELTKAYDKASPQLYECGIETGNGAVVTKRMDKSSPLLYESMVESSDGVELTKAYDKASPKLASWSLRFGHISKLNSDSVLMAAQVDTMGASTIAEAREGEQWGTENWHVQPTEIEDHYRLKIGAQDSAAVLNRLDASGCTSSMNWWGPRFLPITSLDSTQIVISGGPLGATMGQRSRIGNSVLEGFFGTTPMPSEEVALHLSHIGTTLPTEEISLSTGRGSDPVGMFMLNATSPEGDAPADTNVQLHATTQGGSVIISNVGGSFGDGLAITVTDDENALRLRHGGANTGVWLEANPSTGGKIGINTETPSEELQVVGDICATGNIGACSDLRFKRDIETIRGALDVIQQLRGVRFAWNRDEFPQQRFSDQHQIGLVAQEVVGILPEVVSKGADGYYNLDYGKLTPLLIEAVKELKTQNDELRAKTDRIAKLESQMNDLKALLQQLAEKQ